MLSLWYLAALLALVSLSAFFSASEMAVLSANQLRLENMADAGSRRAKAAVRVVELYDDTISAILIGNNLANIAASSVATVAALLIAGGDPVRANTATATAAAAVTVIILIFGETMPKIVAKKNANRLTLAFAYPLRFLTILLRPVIFIAVGLVRLLTRPFGGDGSGHDGAESATQEELVSIIETVEDEGVIDGERSELLQAALDFSDISAREVMTARVDMTAIDADDDWEDILRAVICSPHSRLPVFEGSIDNIIGVLYLNRFLKAAVDARTVDIRTLLMPACFVYKTVKLPSVLSEFRRKQTHIAIVTDDYGGTMGVITMEDVLEQLVGEIWDETDEVVSAVIERSDGSYEIEGDMAIADFLELLELDEDSFETESATVGGWTIERFGSFPGEGDAFTHTGLRVSVLEMDGLRVSRVLVKRLESGASDG